MEGEFDLSMDMFEDDFFEQSENEETVNPQEENEGLENNENNSAENESSEEVGREEEQEEGEGSDDDGESSSNLYSSIAKVIHENGLLPSLDLEKNNIQSVEDFVEAFRKESDVLAQSKVDEIINNLDLEKIAQHKQSSAKLEEITLDHLENDTDLAKSLIKEDYLNQGISEDRVKRMMVRLDDLGESAILEEAQESLKSLQVFNEKRIAEEKEAYAKKVEAVEKQNAENQARLKKYVFEKEDLINGYKPTKAMQDAVYKSITEVVGKNPESGELENAFMRDRREDPIGFETRMYYMYNLTNGFKDFSKLASPAKSNAVNELERVFKKSRTIDNSMPNYMNDGDSYEGSLDFDLNI